MPRFFFNVRTSQRFVADPDGTELPDVARAKIEADKSARDLLAVLLKKGEVLDGQTFEITDESGIVVLEYAFKEALRLA